MDLTSAFHFRDPALMSRMVADIPRDTLLVPVKKGRAIRNRYFKGMRIGGDKPTRQQFAKSYQRQVVEQMDNDLATFLCLNWCVAKYRLVHSALELLGLSDEKVLERALNRIHERVSAEGYEQVIEVVVRDLHFDFEPEDLAIFTGIVCANVSDVDKVRKHLQTILDVLTTDPSELMRALQPKIETITRRRKRLSKLRDQAETQHQEETAKFENNVHKLDRRTAATKRALSKTNTKIQKLESQLQAIQEDLNPLIHDRSEMGDALERDAQARSKLSTSYENETKKIEESIKSIAAEFERKSQELTEYQVLIADAEAKIEEERVKSELSSNKESGPEEKAATDDSRKVTKRQPTQSEFLDSLIADIRTENFAVSSPTLEILAMVRGGELKKGQPSKRPMSRSIDSARDWVEYAAQKTVNSNWNTKEIPAYAYWRSLTQPKRDRNAQSGHLISGLYHAFPANEVWIDPLLIRLFESLAGVDPDVCVSGTPSHKLLAALERTEDIADKRQLGFAQVDVAFADGRLLTRLYDLIGGRSRLQLKRSLVDAISGTTDLDERDPTHELIDIVITQLDAIRAVFRSNLENFRRQASLETIGSERQEILNAMAKLKLLAGDFAKVRIEDCRKILSTEVTRAVKSQTHEGYTRLLSRCTVFLKRELEDPMWVSSRFLFPLVIETARAGMGAERDARRSLKADLLPLFEKNEYPIGEAGRTIEPVLHVVNDGNTVAQGASIMIMPHVDAAEQVDMEIYQLDIGDVQPRGNPVTKSLTITTKAALSVLELEYVITWRDASHEDRSCTGMLKLTAQRQVDWEKASTNPYTMHSISDPERLKGRSKQVDRLLKGVQSGNSFYLTGQKRVGKTSVARVLNKKANALERTLSVYIPLGDMVSKSAGSMLWSMADHLAAAADDHRIEALQDLVPDRAIYDEPASGSAAFVRNLLKRLPNWRFVYVLDDFDELDESLYKGDEAYSFFLHLRSLVDKGNFTLILTGSERLPEILRHQGERLNQVTGLPLDYLAVESLRDLVREPVRQYLEYSDSAVEKVHFLTAGNPYYATQLCNRIHERMTEKRDYYVGPGDVDSGASMLLESLEVSAFQHFWYDGVFDLPPERERFQYMNAMVLIELASLEGPGDLVSRRTLVESPGLKRLNPADIEFRLNHLITRKVVEAKGDLLKLRIPLFAMWLKGRGKAAVRASFGERDTHIFFSPTATGVRESDILSAAEDLYYQEKHVSEIKVKVWLQQFGDPENQVLAFKLLQRLKSKGYFSNTSLHNHFKDIHTRIVASQHAGQGDWAPEIRRRKIVSNLFVTSFDDPGKSGSSLLYTYRNANQIIKPLVGGMDAAANLVIKAKNPVVVVFVDDFIGTGGSCIEGFGKFLEKLEGENISNDHAFYVAALAATGEGIENVSLRTDERLMVIEARQFGSADRAFSPDAEIFANEDEVQRCRRLCENIGRELEPKHPLGYEDSQSLIVFPHRCPNNTLPIFYKSGQKYNGTEWEPLFPR